MTKLSQSASTDYYNSAKDHNNVKDDNNNIKDNNNNINTNNNINQIPKDKKSKKIKNIFKTITSKFTPSKFTG